MNRRQFLQRAGWAAAFPAVAMAQQGNSTAPAPGRFTEPAREIPYFDDADVIVCGGGPAGVAAALAAARAGARTRLFEGQGCLGGVWTAGLLTYIFDFAKPGITQEIKDKLDERGARRSKLSDRFVYDPEAMKLILEQLCTRAGVKFTLHTRVSAAYRSGRRLSTIVTDSKSDRRAYSAKVFIDATGDGDLGAQARCNWEFGQSNQCPCQPMTLNALAVVKDIGACKPFLSFHENDDMKVHVKATEALRAEIRRAGIDPSYGMPTIFPIRDNLVMLMVNHEYNIEPFDAEKVTAATVRARAEVHAIADALRKLGGPWEGLQVVASAEQIGVRDGRRIAGRYRMTREDLTGARHPDAVARVTFGVDIHAPTREENKDKSISHGDVKFRAYDIPLRALIAKDVDGLMMAGRCISGDFISHASYRVTGNAVAMGEAAGATAAVAAASSRLPHQVDWSEAQAALKRL